METRNAYDTTPLNILTAIKKLDRKVIGTKNSYNILSNFAHPNFFDSMTAHSNQSSELNEFGDMVFNFVMSAKKPFKVDPELSNILGLADDILIELVQFYLVIILESEKYIREAKAFCKNLVESDLQFYVNERAFKKTGLRKGTKCPCFSGLRIKDCCGKHLF